MSDIFISYARSTATQAQAVAEALRALGYGVWRDDELPAHRAYTDVIEERLQAAKAVVVIWSAEAVKSQWVQSEADRAREDNKLVQLTVDASRLPMPFDRIQCADMTGWAGDLYAPGWQKVVASIGELIGAPARPAAVTAESAVSRPTLPDKPSIAVLPFPEMGGAKDEDYFADGMVEEIAAALSRFPSLFVIDSGSTLTYRNSGLTPRQIARELAVKYVLEGSVRRSGPRVRISVQLVDTLEGEQIWAERFEGTLEDVFALQDTVANAVAGQIEPTIETAEIRRAHLRPTEDLRAYDLFLQALHLQRKWQPALVHEAIDLIGKALELDPDYAVAAGFAGYCHMLVAIFGWSEDLEGAGRAGMELARRSLQPSMDDPRVLSWAAYAFLFFEHDWATAEDLTERALAHTPGASLGWHVRGWVNLYTDRPETALADFEKAMRLDPRAPERHIIVAGVGWCLFFLRRLEEAIPALRHARQIGPGNLAPLMIIAAAQAHLGRRSEAETTITGLPSNWPYATWLKTLRDEPQREFLRSGLALAGAGV